MCVCATLQVWRAAIMKNDPVAVTGVVESLLAAREYAPL